MREAIPRSSASTAHCWRCPNGIKGIGKAVSRVGIWFLMIAFGASFGYTVMGRLSLLIGRVQFLLFEWLKLPQ